MIRPLLRTACGAAAIVASDATLGEGQALATRIDAVRTGRVQFEFAARDGVCGSGRSFSVGSDMHVQMSSDWRSNEPCQRGPVRVALARIDGAIVGIDTYVGRGRSDPPALADTRDLGPVRAADAAHYLLGVAATVDGRPGRDAILPAMLADSAEVTAALLAIAQNHERPRDTRRTAIGWLGRSGGGPATGERIAEALVRIARNDNDVNAVREQALRTLGRLDNGQGIPRLLDLARPGGDSWLAREAIEALAHSGDPRARAHLRSIVERAELPDDMLAIAIRGIGREYATSQDVELLRRTYPRLTSERTKRSVIGAVAEAGGAANERWLLAIAADEGERQSLRHHALQQARQAGVPIGELIALYDRTADQRMKELLITVYIESGDKAATDKLLAILRSEQNSSLRRRVINSLSRSEDPRVKEALQRIVEQ